MFSSYGINKCIQKIAFLANLKEETGFFKQSKEERSSYKSSQSTYKGRGILQITGTKDSTEYYNNSGPYKTYGAKIGKESEIVNNPDLLSENLHYAIDVGGWVWDVFKTKPDWGQRGKNSGESESDYKAKMEAYKWKREYFDKAKKGDSLNDIALLMADEEEKYFYLTAKLLNGYGQKHTNNVDPMGWDGRKTALSKLKSWFKYNKNVCDGQAPLQFGDMSPWIEIAIQEEVKIIRESTYCKYIKDTYHASTDNAKMSRCGSESDATRENSAWCASFVNYCLETSGHSSQQDPGARWYKDVNRVKRSKEKGVYHTSEIWAKKHTEMYIGGVVVWANNGHTTFVVGIDKNKPNNYIFLGGNQTNGVRFWTAPKSKIHNFCLFPNDYNGDLIPLKEVIPSDFGDNVKFYEEGSTS
ncbi:MAG: hypothetical protein ACK5IC_03290 [Moheibacter sp.]